MSHEILRRFAGKLIFALFIAFLLPASDACFAALPEGHQLPPGWVALPVVNKPLANNSPNAGRWLTYELRSPSGDPVFLQFMPEAESGPLHIPVTSAPRLDGLMGMGATYSTVNEESFKAIMETHPYLGNTVSATLPSGGIVVLQSKVLPLLDLLDLCRFLVSPAAAADPVENAVFVVP